MSGSISSPPATCEKHILSVEVHSAVMKCAACRGALHLSQNRINWFNVLIGGLHAKFEYFFFQS